MWLEGMCLRIDGLAGCFWWLARGEKCGLCGFEMVFGWWDLEVLKSAVLGGNIFGVVIFVHNGQEGIPQGLKPLFPFAV